MSYTSEHTSSEISSSNTCANCGKEGSDVKNTCNKCKMVMYCNAACKKKHRHKHKKACEEHLQRVADLHDEKLFKQPPPAEECLICFIRLPTLITGRTYMACCGKVICSGCTHAPVRDHEGNVIAEKTCPFCRTPAPYSDEELIKRYKKRADLNDARAIYNLGGHYYNGVYGLSRNCAKAVELFHRAAKLGDADAYYGIGAAYDTGDGVEYSDEKKANHYYELAAIRGDPYARHNVGAYEACAGNMDRALKHWMIAATDGDLDSLNNIKDLYIDGNATKDDYEKALCCYQLYVDEIKTDERDKAAIHHGNSYY